MLKEVKEDEIEKELKPGDKIIMEIESNLSWISKLNIVTFKGFVDGVISREHRDWYVDFDNFITTFTNKSRDKIWKLMKF